MPEPLTIALGVAAAWALLSGGGTPVADSVADKYVPDREPGTKGGAARTAEKRANLKTIEREFRSAGITYPPAIAAAMVNAYKESGWNHRATGDGGHSIGLFQLNDWGAGHDMTVEARQDPATNARTMLEREVLAKTGRRFREAIDRQADVGELAYLFCYDLERPANREGDAKERAALARAMFPQYARQA